MGKFYIRSVVFWFVLLVLAIGNAVLRESTYKPLLTPYIGIWAHQISSIVGILLFFAAIYVFLKLSKEKYQIRELVCVGSMWIVMTLLFEVWMNMAVRHLSFRAVLATYYFWNGELWIFVLLSLVVSPLVAARVQRRI